MPSAEVTMLPSDRNQGGSNARYATFNATAASAATVMIGNTRSKSSVRKRGHSHSKSWWAIHSIARLMAADTT